MKLIGNRLPPNVKPPEKKLRGLGDVVAMFAKPVATVSDKVFKTKLTNCAPCQQRRQKLNQQFPL